MKIKTMVLVFLAVTAGVFAYTRPHNTIPFDLRDAVSDSAFDTLKKGAGADIEVPAPGVPKASGNSTSSAPQKAAGEYYESQKKLKLFATVVQAWIIKLQALQLNTLAASLGAPRPLYFEYELVNFYSETNLWDIYILTELSPEIKSLLGSAQKSEITVRYPEDIGLTAQTIQVQLGTAMVIASGLQPSLVGTTSQVYVGGITINIIRMSKNITEIIHRSREYNKKSAVASN